jgi:hypothetical protein
MSKAARASTTRRGFGCAPPDCDTFLQAWLEHECSCLRACYLAHRLVEPRGVRVFPSHLRAALLIALHRQNVLIVKDAEVHAKRATRSREKGMAVFVPQDTTAKSSASRSCRHGADHPNGVLLRIHPSSSRQGQGVRALAQPNGKPRRAQDVAYGPEAIPRHGCGPPHIRCANQRRDRVGRRDLLAVITRTFFASRRNKPSPAAPIPPEGVRRGSWPNPR